MKTAAAALRCARALHPHQHSSGLSADGASSTAFKPRHLHDSSHKTSHLPAFSTAQSYIIHTNTSQQGSTATNTHSHAVDTQGQGQRPRGMFMASHLFVLGKESGFEEPGNMDPQAFSHLASFFDNSAGMVKMVKYKARTRNHIALDEIGWRGGDARGCGTLLLMGLVLIRLAALFTCASCFMWRESTVAQSAASPIPSHTAARYLSRAATGTPPLRLRGGKGKRNNPKPWLAQRRSPIMKNAR
jgi:hypothetical protein